MGGWKSFFIVGLFPITMFLKFSWQLLSSDLKVQTLQPHLRAREFPGKCIFLIHDSDIGGPKIELLETLARRLWFHTCSVSVTSCLITKLCLILCDPMDCSPPGSSVNEIFQARVLEWVAISSSRGSS